ncbi:glycosyltransferase, partial [Phytoactinopolyspora endophytica]|uniref:glycosyltransferase n=1 Tax=Phytoactinopolyspora endophytica TaxID=1642495 RepID=UPI0013EDB7AD
MPCVVIPAHNEERVLGRLLAVLIDVPSAGDGLSGEDEGREDGVEPASDMELDVIVVANGCDDATAEVAAGFAGVRVVETPVASKSAALRLGDEAATGFPRLYVDADVVIGRSDVDELCRALSVSAVHVAGPERVLPMDDVAWPVRWYYDVWTRLPVARRELFGRGVIAVDEGGHERLTPFFAGDDDVMADDLAMALAFSDDERVVVPAARVEVRPPRAYADLMRRRVRAMTGNARMSSEDAGPDRSAGVRPAPRTGLRELGRVVADEPGLYHRA